MRTLVSRVKVGANKHANAMEGHTSQVQFNGKFVNNGKLVYNIIILDISEDDIDDVYVERKQGKEFLFVRYKSTLTDETLRCEVTRTVDPEGLEYTFSDSTLQIKIPLDR